MLLTSRKSLRTRSHFPESRTSIFCAWSLKWWLSFLAAWTKEFACWYIWTTAWNFNLFKIFGLREFRGLEKSFLGSRFIKRIWTSSSTVGTAHLTVDNYFWVEKKPLSEHDMFSDIFTGTSRSSWICKWLFNCCMIVWSSTFFNLIWIITFDESFLKIAYYQFYVNQYILWKLTITGFIFLRFGIRQVSSAWFGLRFPGHVTVHVLPPLHSTLASDANL